MAKKHNPVKYLQDKGFRITSDPNEYRESYPNGKRKPWGKRDLMSYGINADSYCGGYHRAYDFSKHHNAGIPAIANAKVAPGTGWNTFGWTLVLTFFDAAGKHYQVIYGHLNRNPLKDFKVGQTVKQGQTVAYQGRSNNIGVSNMASHLHIQWQNYGALAEQPFTCNGIDPLNIDVSETYASAPPSKGGKVTVKKDLSRNNNHAGSGNPMNFITVHQTANTARGANAQAHANFINNGSAATWHYTVDDTHAIQHFYESTRCYHAGDGKGKGNYESIGIEMCVNSDGDYNQTLSNAASLIADIMNRRNIPLKNVVSHGYWTGKDCPRELLGGKNGISWNDFKKMIQQGGGVVQSNDAPAPSKPASKPEASNKKTPYTVGSWKKNKHGTQYIKAVGTFTVGDTRIMSRANGPFVSNPEGGWCYPGHKIKYAYLCRQDGRVWIQYKKNGKWWFLPYNTWDNITGAVGKGGPWGTFS